MIWSKSHTASDTPGTKPAVSPNDCSNLLLFYLPALLLISKKNSNSLLNSPQSQVAYVVQKRTSPLLMLPVEKVESSQSTLAVTSHCHMVSLLNTGPAQSGVQRLLVCPAQERLLAQILHLLPRCHKPGFQDFTSFVPCLCAQSLMSKA